ncbi:palindromic element RPE4 domain-containing protein [Rickettsia asembonensis]
MPSMSYRGLTTVSRKTTKNINIIDIFNWIP